MKMARTRTQKEEEEQERGRRRQRMMMKMHNNICSQKGARTRKTKDKEEIPCTYCCKDSKGKRNRLKVSERRRAGQNKLKPETAAKNWPPFAKRHSAHALIEKSLQKWISSTRMLNSLRRKQGNKYKWKTTDECKGTGEQWKKNQSPEGNIRIDNQRRERDKELIANGEKRMQTTIENQESRNGKKLWARNHNTNKQTNKQTTKQISKRLHLLQFVRKANENMMSRWMKSNGVNIIIESLMKLGCMFEVIPDSNGSIGRSSHNNRFAITNIQSWKERERKKEKERKRKRCDNNRFAIANFQSWKEKRQTENSTGVAKKEQTKQIGEGQDKVSSYKRSREMGATMSNETVEPTTLNPHDGTNKKQIEREKTKKITSKRKRELENRQTCNRSGMKTLCE